jgi:spermidine synthase
MHSPFKFLRRVRIHGGGCGAVARALHHVNEIELSFKPI